MNQATDQGSSTESTGHAPGCRCSPFSPRSRPALGLLSACDNLELPEAMPLGAIVGVLSPAARPASGQSVVLFDATEALDSNAATTVPAGRTPTALLQPGTRWDGVAIHGSHLFTLPSTTSSTTMTLASYDLSGLAPTLLSVVPIASRASPTACVITDTCRTMLNGVVVRGSRAYVNSDTLLREIDLEEPARRLRRSPSRAGAARPPPATRGPQALAHRVHWEGVEVPMPNRHLAHPLMPWIADGRPSPGGPPLTQGQTPSAWRDPAPLPSERAEAPHSRWALPLGHPFGIRVSVHLTFLLLLAWVALSRLAAGETPRQALAGVTLVVLVFGVVVLHELGHALTARRFGVKTRGILLLPIGGVATMDRLPEKPWQELLVALAGPAVNVALAGALALVLTLLGEPLVRPPEDLVRGGLLAQLMWINVSLALFNLLPAFPMDGGRVLRAVLAFRLDYAKATLVAARIGQTMALFLGFVGLFVNPLLVVIALFVWMGARTESSLVQLRAALRGIPVRSAMVTDFKVLSPSDPLTNVVALILDGFQHEFPVVLAGEVVGVVTRDDVVRGLASGGEHAPVALVMRKDFERADPSELLESALTRLEQRDASVLVVERHGELLGLVTPENVGELLLLDDAAHHPRPRRVGVV